MSALEKTLAGELTEKRFAALKKVLDTGDKEGRWLVLTHDNPDPDALISTQLLAKLLRQGFGRKVTVAHSGIVGRAENREMVRVLGMKFSWFRHLNLKQYRHFALVDTQPGTGNNSLPDSLQPTLVIDHHPARKATYQADFSDLRRDYGATATILLEYLEAAGIPLGKKGATGVIYAIRTETQDFAREYEAPDRAAFDLYLPQADKRLLGRIQSAPLSLSYFATLQRALVNLESVDTLVVSHLGEVRRPDIVPEIADLLLRMEGKTWSLATGLVADKIFLSIRTTNPRAEAGRLMRRLIGARGKGGGHGMIAGGWVSLARNGKTEDPETAQRALAARLAKALRKNPERLSPLDLEIEKLA